jgi:hypothetical protein
MKMRLLLCLLSIVALAGCTQIPYDDESFPQNVSSELSFNMQDVLYRTRCEYGVTAVNQSSAILQQCVFVYTKNQIILLSWDKNKGAYKKDLTVPLTQIESAALNSFGLSRQLQLFTALNQLVINLYPGGPSRQIDDTEMIFGWIKSAGIKVIDSRGWVRPVTSGMIPIFLPSR